MRDWLPGAGGFDVVKDDFLFAVAVVCDRRPQYPSTLTARRCKRLAEVSK